MTLVVKIKSILAHKPGEIPDRVLFIRNIFIKLQGPVINGFNQLTPGGQELLFVRKIDDVTNLNGIEA